MIASGLEENKIIQEKSNKSDEMKADDNANVKLCAEPSSYHFMLEDGLL